MNTPHGESPAHLTLPVDSKSNGLASGPSVNNIRARHMQASINSRRDQCSLLLILVFRVSALGLGVRKLVRGGETRFVLPQQDSP